MIKILLVGGAGFLGINIAISLVESGFCVFIVDKNCQHLRCKKHLSGVSGFFDSNVADVERLVKFVDELAIDCVINLVSTLLPSSTLDDFLSEIELCTLPGFRLISNLADRGVKYVFFSSGGTVYGRVKNEILSEVDRCHPVNLYGYSKLLFEEYIECFCETKSLDYLIIRPSNPYGMHQNPLRMQGFIAVAMSRLMKGEAIEIWGDGLVVRDYILVSDMADALALLLKKNLWSTTFNIGSGVGHSLLEVIHVMEAISGRQAEVIYKKPRLVDVDRIVLDVSRLQNEISFHPHSLVDGIGLYYEGLFNEAV